MTSRNVLMRIVVACLLIRVILEGVGLLALAADGQPALSNGLDLWNRWDAPHYLRVAEVGYRRGVPPPDDPLFIVFFPFFPLAVRAGSVIARNLVLSGLIVSFAATVGAAWFLYRLVALDEEEGTAWRAVVLLFSFPTAYFLAAPYSEALFLFAVVASMYAARTGRWVGSGLAGAAATGTRVTGVALGPALVVEALSGEATQRDRLRRLACVALAGAGLLVYLTINQVVHGDAFWFLEVQRSHWHQEPVPPWQPIVTAVSELPRVSGDLAFIYAGRLIGFVFALPLLVLAIRHTRPADAVYAWTGFVLIMSASWLLSLPRYLLVLYPLFVVGAKLTRSRWASAPVVVIGCALQVWLFSRYAVGQWTF